MTGDMELGQEYFDAIYPLVWTACERDQFVADVQEMRQRVENNLPAAQVTRELKLGRGGLRDVEFAVQLLQMVHGRTDTTLRVRATGEALDALAEGGYISRHNGRIELRIRLSSPPRTLPAVAASSTHTLPAS